MVKEMDEDLHSRSYESTSDEDEQQMTERNREQEDKIWGLEKELDDQWEVQNQRRWHKAQDIWDDEKDECLNKNESGEEEYKQNYGENNSRSKESINGDDMDMVGESDPSGESSGSDNDEQVRSEHTVKKGCPDEQVIR